MSQTGPRDLEGGGNPGPGMYHSSLRPILTNFTNVYYYIVDGQRDRSQSTLDRPWQLLEGEFDYCDNSWPLYSMYSKITEEEDDKMIERCHKDADGILIFVRLHFSPRMTPHIN
jgi:hypothetical protein